ncbi:MAG: hypothetical protein IM613_17160 [Cytophagales bacterium]|nr:hypothetical protein [Cytophagales bacterium]
MGDSAKKTSDFNKGYFCACAVLLKQHRDEKLVYELMNENFTSLEKLRADGVDEYDIELLMPVIKEIYRVRKLGKHNY